MPTRRDEAGFCAAARMARPSGVSLKKANSSATMSSATTMVPTSCADISGLAYQASAGNGLGNGLMV
jgi:ribosome-binding ATPase YchF (GTP1/OBG family)